MALRNESQSFAKVASAFCQQFVGKVLLAVVVPEGRCNGLFHFSPGQVFRGFYVGIVPLFYFPVTSTGAESRTRRLGTKTLFPPNAMLLGAGIEEAPPPGEKVATGFGTKNLSMFLSLASLASLAFMLAPHCSVGTDCLPKSGQGQGWVWDCPTRVYLRGDRFCDYRYTELRFPNCNEKNRSLHECFWFHLWT